MERDFYTLIELSKKLDCSVRDLIHDCARKKHFICVNLYGQFDVLHWSRVLGGSEGSEYDKEFIGREPKEEMLAGLFVLDEDAVRYIDTYGQIQINEFFRFDDGEWGSWETLENSEGVLVQRRNLCLLACDAATYLQPRLPNKQDLPLSTRERDTLLMLIAVMAKEGYKHDPANKSRSAVSEIVADVQKLGLSISNQTVLDKLNAAWTLLPGTQPKA